MILGCVALSVHAGIVFFFFFQAEDGIRDKLVTGVQTCALPISQPTGRFFGRKPSELRVAAVEALRLAATPAALGTLEGLSDDGDREVREAASRGVAELKRKTRR